MLVLSGGTSSIMEDVESNFIKNVPRDEILNNDSDLDVENCSVHDIHGNAETGMPPIHLQAIQDQSLNQSTIITCEDVPQNVCHRKIYLRKDDSLHEALLNSTAATVSDIITTSVDESEANDDSVTVITSSCSKNGISDTTEVLPCDIDENDGSPKCASDVLPKVAEVHDFSYSQSNPFNDDGLDDETPVLTLNPFNDEDENQDVSVIDGVASMNPFGDDSIDSTPMGESSEEQLSQNLRQEHMSPLNPFDDGDSEEFERVHVKLEPQQRKEETFFLSATVPVSQVNKTRVKPFPETQCEVPQRTFSKEYNELIALGFDKICAGNALQKTSGDLSTARKMLMTRLFDDRVLANDELYVWKSPVMIRVGR